MIPEETSSSSEVETLKNQVFILLIALIVVSGTLTIFLYRQASLTNKDIDEAQKNAQRVGEAVARNESAVGTFVGELMEYGQKHPDFLPVLKKYGMVPTPGMPALTPAPAPKK